MEKVDVLVVGGGVMGCSAAAALARGGAKTALIEAGRIGNLDGSSHGRSRIIRLAYGSVGYIALCRAAYGAWRALEDEAGEQLLCTTGGLDLAPPGVPTWERARAAMAAAGVPFDELDADGLCQRFPQFAVPEGTRALHQPDAGVLHADACLAALARAARRHGAVIHEGTTVTAIRTTRDGVQVEAGGQEFGADRAILAAGARMNEALGMIGAALPLTVSTEQVAYFRPRESAAFVTGRFPVFINHFHDGRLGSGFPLLRDSGLKLMLEHKRPRQMRADGSDVPPPPDRLEALRRHARSLLPGLTGEILGSATCLYTLTPDEDFVIDRLPGNPRIVVVSACSGHGFKFGALFGEAIADLALDRRPAIDLAPFGMSRFGGEVKRVRGGFAMMFDKERAAGQPPQQGAGR